MLSIILSACVLVALTMYIHALGIALLLRYLMKLDVLPSTRIWSITLMLLRMIWWLILIHLAEVTVWALFYLWRE